MKTLHNLCVLLAFGVLGACGFDEDTDTDTDVGEQPRGAENPPPLGAQIDRMGRPGINTALNNTFNGDVEAKEAAKNAYNIAEPETWDTWADEIETSLAILDGLDTVCGNQLLADASDDRYATLAAVLADDQLYVDTSTGTCGIYLGVEAEAVGVLAEGEGGCGGRTQEDDVIERTYSTLAAGVLTGIDDGLVDDDSEPLSDFPYLPAPTE